jgi:hypothetical protein
MEEPHIRRLKNARPGIAEIDAWCQVLHGELAAELHTNGSAMSVPWTVFAAKQLRNVRDQLHSLPAAPTRRHIRFRYRDSVLSE